jgi:hypothetical protein
MFDHIKYIHVPVHVCESFHLIAKVWYQYDKLAGKHAAKGELYRLFAIARGKSMPKALTDLHLTAWKFILMALVRRDLALEPFHPDSIWKRTLSRYARNVHAIEFRALSTVRRWASRDNTLTSAPIRHLRKAL